MSIPATLTAEAANKAANVTRKNLVASTRVPKLFATSSPNCKAFNNLLLILTPTKPMIVYGKIIVTCFHEAPEKPPAIQFTVP